MKYDLSMLVGDLYIRTKHTDKGNIVKSLVLTTVLGSQTFSCGYAL